MASVRKSGIEVDDALEISEQTEICPSELRLHVSTLMEFLQPLSGAMPIAHKQRGSQVEGRHDSGGGPERDSARPD